MKSRERTRNRLPAIAVAAALVAVLAGCSAGDEPSVQEAADGAGRTWGSCMRAQGIDIDDPSDDAVRSGSVPRPQSIEQGQFDEAAADCFAKVGIEPKSTADKQKWDREYAKVADCIRDAGFDDFPEMEPGGFGWDDYAREDEPEFQDTVASCMQQYSPDTQSQNVG
jgi:hypothetical protein